MIYQRQKPLVYTAGPYRASNAWLVELNVRIAELRAIEIAALGATPICPQSMTRFFDGTMTDAYWLQATQDMLSVCDIVWMDIAWRRSEGSISEHEFAKKYGIQIVYEHSELVKAVRAWKPKLQER